MDLDAQLDGEVDLLNSDVEDLGSPYPAPPSGGTIDADPDFENAGSNVFRLICGSPCINTGLYTQVPNDAFDLDQDGTTTAEFNPDLELLIRIVTVVDIGAYEKAPENCLADTDGNCAVDVDDLIAVILGWGSPCSNCNGDVAPPPCGGDGNVDIDDLIAVILAWGACANCTPTGTSNGADPQSYADCQSICDGLTGDAWTYCMQACFRELCEKGHTEFCE
jgi:hypothetical protein